jgi:hypothetical protein
MYQSLWCGWSQHVWWAVFAIWTCSRWLHRLYLSLLALQQISPVTSYTSLSSGHRDTDSDTDDSSPRVMSSDGVDESNCNKWVSVWASERAWGLIKVPTCRLRAPSSTCCVWSVTTEVRPWRIYFCKKKCWIIASKKWQKSEACQKRADGLPLTTSTLCTMVN